MTGSRLRVGTHEWWRQSFHLVLKAVVERVLGCASHYVVVVAEFVGLRRKSRQRILTIMIFFQRCGDDKDL